MRRRENTFRIDYANVPKKPSFEEVHEFVETVLLMKREEVQRIQCSRYHGCAFVKANDLAVAQRVVDEHDQKHETEVDGKIYKLRIRMEDGAVEVKLHDLPEEVSDAVITEFLSAYGEVISIHELLWNGNFSFPEATTGVRVAKMVVKTNIPSFVTIDGEPTCVTYYGQRQTCRHCREFVHIGISCVQNKKLMLQKLSADQPKISYASVTKQTTVPRPPVPRLTPAQPPRPKLPGPKPASVKPAEPTASSSGTKPSSPARPKPPNPLMKKPSVPKPATPSTEVAFKAPNQPIPTSGDALRKSAPGGKNDGAETDESTASANSRRSRGRPPGKKLRQNVSDGDDSEDADFLL